MKFWNKHPEIRKRCWTRVELSADGFSGYSGSIKWPHLGWKNYGRFDDLYRFLQRWPGKGRFYANCSINEVWFENTDDAIWFKLTYKE